MSGEPGHLETAREHVRSSRWVRACEEYAAADRATPLTVGTWSPGPRPPR